MTEVNISQEAKQKLINSLNLVNGVENATPPLNTTVESSLIKLDTTNSSPQLNESERANSVRRKSAVLSLKNGTWEVNDEELKDSKNDLDEEGSITSAKKRPLSFMEKVVQKMSQDKHKTWAIVMMLGGLNLLMILASGLLERQALVKQGSSFRFQLKEDVRTFDLLDEYGNEVLSLHYGVNIPPDIKPVKCSHLGKDGKQSHLCRDWLYRASLSVGVDSKPNKINCYNVIWRSYTSKEHLRDCFDLKNGYWYGMGHVRNSPWPLNEWSQPLAPFITSAELSEENPFGSIIRRYWISSKAVSIFVPLDIPLYVSFNETRPDGQPSNQMCFQANVNQHPYNTDQGVKLEYTICTGNEFKQLHSEISKNWTNSAPAHEPGKAPEVSLIENPVWSSHQLPQLNQTELNTFTNNIQGLSNNMTGILLIDSRWESSLGDLRVNETRFPAANDTFKAIKNRGWKIMLTVTPFIDINAKMLLQASSEKRIVLDDQLRVPLLTRCTPEEELQFCAVLDIMQKSNGEWFKQRLMDNLIRAYGINSLMFKGVEVSRMPQHQHAHMHNIVNPDYFQVFYMDVGSSVAKHVGMSTGAGVKDFNGFLRMPSLVNSWEALQSIIPTVLSLGLIGYPLINTGSVGGDSLLNEHDEELYVRWLELALFLPIVQFARVESISNLDIAHIKAFKKYQNIRRNELQAAMLACLKENKKFGWPIIRPMWWLQSNDSEFFGIKDQFTIGDDVIVAPILHKGATKRDIVLPRGLWQDMLTLRNVKGDKTLYDYPIELNQIAFFRRVKQDTTQSL